MLKGNLFCEEISKVSTRDGKVKVAHDRVCNRPRTGKLMGKACIGTSESG